MMDRSYVARRLLALLIATSMFHCGYVLAQGCDAAASFRNADSLLKQRQYVEAIAMLKPLRACGGLTPIETFNLGWLYGRAHDFATAVAILRSVDANVPDRQTHAYAIALGELELEDYKGVVAELKPLQEDGSINAESANLLAVAYSKLGMYQDAYPLLAEELKRNPNDEFAYLNLVTLLSDAGKFAEAAQVAGAAVVAFPQDAGMLVVRGAAYTLQGEVAKARGDFAAAVTLAPKQADARFLLAVTDYKQGSYAIAADELRAAIGAGVVDSDLHYLLAECLLKLDVAKTADAMAELNRAIVLRSDSVSARALRGKLLLEEQQPKAAVVDLELAHKVDPDSRSATYNLARAYFALGRTEDAKVLYKELHSQSVDAVNELSDQKAREALGAKEVLAGSSSESGH